MIQAKGFGLCEEPDRAVEEVVPGVTEQRPGAVLQGVGGAGPLPEVSWALERVSLMRVSPKAGHRVRGKERVNGCVEGHLAVPLASKATQLPPQDQIAPARSCTLRPMGIICLSRPGRDLS